MQSDTKSSVQLSTPTNSSTSAKLNQLAINNNSYDKRKRLLKSAQFRQVFDHADKKMHQPHLMAFVCSNNKGYARLGIAITKRKVSTAVARNRLKRLIREQFRKRHLDLPAIDMVFIVKKPIDELSTVELNQQIQFILNKCSNKRHSKSIRSS